MDKTVTYKLQNNAKLSIEDDSVFKLEPDTPEPMGIGYMQIGTTFRIS